MDSPHPSPDAGPAKGTLRWALLGFFLIGLLGMLALPLLPRGREAARRAQALSEAHAATAAIEKYTKEYGQPPSGSPTEVLAMLLGKNQRGIQFFYAPPKRLTPAGDFLDPWNMPYRIDRTDDAHPRFYSCGPNRRNEALSHDSDDIGHR